MESWKEFFESISSKDYVKKLKTFLDSEYRDFTIYPERKNLFKAFELCPVNQIKIVLIGQDPYHEPNQAMGLAFSVPKGVKIPPSLRNIYREIENDLLIKMDYSNGDLTYLANQGVFLLNAYLSVRKSSPLSHHNELYDSFTRDVICFLNELDQPIVFMLWGSFAKKYQKYLTNKNHLILTANHPSPLSANRGGWFNNKHFSKANYFLIKNHLVPIVWQN